MGFNSAFKELKHIQSKGIQVYDTYTIVSNCTTYCKHLGHAVAQLVEALRYKSEGRGFDSRWYQWNFSLT